MDFHGYLVLEDCVSLLQATFEACGDFTQDFPLGRFLKFLGYVFN